MQLTPAGPRLARTVAGMDLGKAHPALAVVAPPRLARFRERLGLADDDPIDADFTGWSKLVLLTERHAVLFPRDHTQVDALAREVVALRAIEPLRLHGVPVVHEVIEDPSISAHPVVVLDRQPGRSLDDLIEGMPITELTVLFEELGRLAAGWHQVDPETVPELPRRSTLDSTSLLVDELELDAGEARRAATALERARTMVPVLVHGDLHEGQLLVDPDPPHPLTGIIDWQTARIDHPFVEFDLGEWGTAIWRGHRRHFAELRACAWAAYARARGLPDDLGAVFEWHHALAHARKVLGVDPFPVVHGPEVVGTPAEAREAVRRALAQLPE
jgi:aminoglycoside phosphotransferase (APT) family kinase protein